MKSGKLLNLEKSGITHFPAERYTRKVGLLIPGNELFYVNIRVVGNLNILFSILLRLDLAQNIM